MVAAPVENETSLVEIPIRIYIYVDPDFEPFPARPSYISGVGLKFWNCRAEWQVAELISTWLRVISSFPIENHPPIVVQQLSSPPQVTF